MELNMRIVKLPEEHLAFILGVLGKLIDDGSITLDLEGKLYTSKVINEIVHIQKVE